MASLSLFSKKYGSMTLAAKKSATFCGCIAASCGLMLFHIWQFRFSTKPFIQNCTSLKVIFPTLNFLIKFYHLDEILNYVTCHGIWFFWLNSKQQIRQVLPIQNNHQRLSTSIRWKWKTHMPIMQKENTIFVFYYLDFKSVRSFGVTLYNAFHISKRILYPSNHSKPRSLNIY